MNEKPLRSGSIEEKIQCARKLYNNKGAALLADRVVVGLLETAAARIEASRKAMIESGVITACTQCDEEEGGSCCGAGIENKYSSVLLLINLLLGVTLPDVRASENSCFFLGTTGCMLKARHVICINYLCTRLQKGIPTEQLNRLQAVTGEEMDTIFILHEKIKTRL
jgi:hypothetical protein